MYFTISQSGYAQRILQRFGMMDCKGRSTPLDAGTFFPRSTTDDPEPPTDITEYQRLSGSIKFLVTGTRPDLAFAISMLSSYNANPNTRHLNGMKQVLRYLHRTYDCALVYQRSTDETILLQTYADASYDAGPDTAKSVAAYIVQMNGGAIAWSSKKQSTVARSTCEAEYMACSEAASQLLWTKQLLVDLRIDTNQPVLWCDNSPAVDLTHNDRITFVSRYIAPHFHFVRQHHSSSFDVRQIPTTDNLPDICTKALPRPAF